MTRTDNGDFLLPRLVLPRGLVPEREVYPHNGFSEHADSAHHLGDFSFCQFARTHVGRRYGQRRDRINAGQYPGHHDVRILRYSRRSYCSPGLLDLHVPSQPVHVHSVVLAIGDYRGCTHALCRQRSVILLRAAWDELS